MSPGPLRAIKIFSLDLCYVNDHHFLDYSDTYLASQMHRKNPPTMDAMVGHLDDLLHFF